MSKPCPCSSADGKKSNSRKQKDSGPEGLGDTGSGDNSHRDLAGSRNSYQNPSSPISSVFYFYYFVPLWPLFTSSFTCGFGYFLPLVPSLGFSVEFLGGHRLCHS